jgi:hypothetical protein
MFSITLKRSVTTLAVMAGLLAVAGPAGASAFSGDAYVNEMGVTAAGDRGSENSIECLLRAEASDEGQTQSRKSAPLTITLCHEGFEIQ